LADEVWGFNSFASEPCGEGLAVFLELVVELCGQVDERTGFVVNVSEIDEAVRTYAVPVFAGRVREEYRAGRAVGFSELAELLRESWAKLADKFGGARVTELSLKVNPFRKIAIKERSGDMVYFGEKFEFAATHTLWNERLSERENLEVFGKCAHRTGHGHNYVVEVTVKAEAADGVRVGQFEQVVNEEVIEVVDHKNLNVDVAEFGKVNPTVENIAVFVWEKLAGKFSQAELSCVTVWETEKTFCSYYGPEGRAG